MTSLGFENYAEALKIYLAKYREVCLNSVSYAFIMQTPSQTQKLTMAQSSNRPENSGRPSSSYGSGVQSGSGSAGPTGVDPGDTNLMSTQLGNAPQEGHPYGNIFPDGNNGNVGNY